MTEIMVNQFGYDLSKSLDEILQDYGYDVSCQGTIPQAITAFLESTDYEDAIRNAISIGGDSDTLSCITGKIAEVFYGEVPEEVSSKVMNIPDEDLVGIVAEFIREYRLNA